MATAKKTTVTLQTKDGKMCREFDIAHAERLLQFTNSQWTLPPKSQFVYKDGSISRKSTKGGKRGLEQNDGKQSN